MKILIISNKIKKIETGLDFTPLSKALAKNGFGPDDISLAPSFQAGVKFAKDNNFGPTDLIFLEIFLRKKDNQIISCCGEKCAAYLIHKHKVNIIVIHQGEKLDNVVNNIDQFIRTEYKHSRPLNEPYLDYLPKEYGLRSNDRSNFEEAVSQMIDFIFD